MWDISERVTEDENNELTPFEEEEIKQALFMTKKIRQQGLTVYLLNSIWRA